MGARRQTPKMGQDTQQKWGPEKVNEAICSTNKEQAARSDSPFEPEFTTWSSRCFALGGGTDVEYAAAAFAEDDLVAFSDLHLHLRTQRHKTGTA